MDTLAIVGHTYSTDSPNLQTQLRINRITNMSPRSASPSKRLNTVRAIRKDEEKELPQAAVTCVSPTGRDLWGGTGRIPFTARTRLFCYEDMLATMSGGDQQCTAIFGEGNNVQAVIKSLRKDRNWNTVISEVAPFPTVNTVSMLWKQTAQGIKWDELCEGSHVVNHFRFAREITTKGQIVRNMMDYFRPKQTSPFQHIPLSFLINDTSRKTDLKNFAKILALMNITGEKYSQREALDSARGVKTPKSYNIGGYHVPATFGFNVWIAKPQCMSRGRGIHVFSTMEELTDIILEAGKKKHQNARLKWSWINRPSNITAEETQILLREKLKRKKRLGYESESSDEEANSLDRAKDAQGFMAQTDQNRSTSCSPTNRWKGYFKVISNANVDVPVSSWVVQKYIERPMLISGRKFDIRVWVVLTPSLHVYMCREGYVRTAAGKYTLDPAKHADSYIHLCNNAIQKMGNEYSKYEDGNQMSFTKFQAYLDSVEAYKHLSVQKHMIPRMQELVAVSLQSTRHHFLRPSGSYGQFKQVSFQLLGYDFMVDDAGELFLIEVNSNPCLEESSALLADLIPKMLDEMFGIFLDSMFKKGTSGLELFELLMCLKHNQVFHDGLKFPELPLSPRRSLSPARRFSNTYTRSGSIPGRSGSMPPNISPARTMTRLGGSPQRRVRKISTTDPRCPRCSRVGSY